MEHPEVEDDVINYDKEPETEIAVKPQKHRCKRKITADQRKSVKLAQKRARRKTRNS